MKLFFQAISKFLLGLLLLALLIFLPAGSVKYPNGLLFLLLLFVPMLVLGIVLFIKAPELLKKRLDSREKEAAQKGVLFVSAMIFPLVFILSGLDFRHGWSRVPLPVVCIASALFLLGYGLYAEVMRENAYLSRTVKVEVGQTVISSGLYRIVRHPMYAVTVWLFLSIPLVLGSWWSLLCFAPYLVVIAVRILNEEKVLEAGLSGYSDYKKRVKYRLLPFIW